MTAWEFHPQGAGVVGDQRRRTPKPSDRSIRHIDLESKLTLTYHIFTSLVRAALHAFFHENIVINSGSHREVFLFTALSGD